METDSKILLLQLQGEILKSTARGVSFPLVAEMVCRKAEELAPGGICTIVLVEGGRLEPVAAPSLSTAYSKALSGVLVGPFAGSCGTAAFRGEPVAVLDIDT